MSPGISIMDLAKRKQITAKLGRMRKAQTFSVYPKQPGDTSIIVQSDKSIGEFDHVTGEGSLCTRGCYFVHLSLGKPFMFPQDFVKEAREIWDPQLELVYDDAVSIRVDRIVVRPYRNGLHGVRVLGSAGVPRTGKHFARWNKS